MNASPGPGTPAEPLETVGETRHALADMLSIPKAHVGHYAVVVDSPEGTILKFCCDDRREAASLLRLGATLLLRNPGESMRADGARPPMPAAPVAAVPVKEDHDA